MLPGSGLVEVRKDILKQNGVGARSLSDRFRAAGVFVVSLVSGPGSGKTSLLDAMVEKALQGWGLEQLDLLFIENAGNPVCPSSYDLGENLRAVLIPVTEGGDKPLQYPTIFKHPFRPYVRACRSSNSPPRPGQEWKATWNSWPGKLPRRA